MIEQPALVVAVIVVVAVVGVLGWRQEQRRLRLLLHWARRHALTRQDGKGRDWHLRYPGLQVLQRGHSRRSTLALEGEIDGRRVVCLDYVFVTGSGKNRTTHRRALVIVETGFPVIPLTIRREHVFDKVGEFLGHDDINFESAEFSRTFHVTAADRKWAYDVIHTRTMEYLLGAPAFTIAFGLGEIAVERNGRLQARHCRQALKVAHAMLDFIPDYALDRLKGGKT